MQNKRCGSGPARCNSSRGSGKSKKGARPEGRGALSMRSARDRDDQFLIRIAMKADGPPRRRISSSTASRPAAFASLTIFASASLDVTGVRFALTITSPRRSSLS